MDEAVWGDRHIEPGVPAPRVHFGLIPMSILAVVVLLLVLMWALFGMLTTIRSEQQTSIQRGYINRAIICDMIKGLGIEEPTNCSDPAIQRYRDKTITAGSTAGAKTSKQTYELVCFVLKQSAKQQGSSVVVPPGLCDS